MLESIRTYLNSDEMAEGKSFYLITTFILLIISALTLFQTPDPMPVSRLSLFAALLTLHLLLHWMSGLAAERRYWGIAYLIIQGALAFALVNVSQQPALALALYATLIAETLGVFGLTRFAALGVLGYILLTALSFYVLGGTAVLDDWLQPTASTFTLLIIFMVLYRRQLDARDRSQELLAELKDANHQLSKYAAQVETLTLATERQRMARELHDTLAQGVAGLILQLEAANAHLENGNVPRAQTIIQHSMKRARSTLADARAAIDDLRLDNSSLADTILRHTDRFTRATGIPCHLTLELNPEEDISSTVVDHADRIIGESLANITRHAQANAAWVVVQQSAENLTIDIRDDGVGFDLVSAEKAGHYGLLGIRERTRLVNGTFEIDSNTHDGTHLTITLPLEAT